MADFRPLGPAAHPELVSVVTASGSLVLVPRGSAAAAAAASAKPAAAAAAPGPSALNAMAAVAAAAGSAAPSAAPAPPRVYKASALPLAERFALCRSVGEECIQEEELRALLDKRPHPVCYDGFEPSGRMHIAQGVLKALNVNKLTRAGCVFKFWVADWFALLNNKYDGDLKKIRTCGQYFVEVWRAAGMEMDNVEFLWASDEINAHANDYWLRVMDIARRFNVPRVVRCCTAMGRKEEDDLSAAQIFYPCMQAADVFFLKADICQLGMDQRKVNMLAREYCDATSPKIKFKPVILSHHMIMGLKEGQEKMSKSDPNSAIFMEDTAAEVKSKIRGAYCPPGVEAGNPCLDWIQHIVFPYFAQRGGGGAPAGEGGWLLKRSAENGGDVLFADYAALRESYVAGALHPGDVKSNLTDALNAILEPVRRHFAAGEPAKLLTQVKSFALLAAKKAAAAAPEPAATAAATATAT